MALTPEEKRQRKRDRSYRRRVEQKKLDQSDGGAVDVDTGERFSIQVLDNDGQRVKNRIPVVEDNLKLIGKKAKTSDEVEEITIEKRQRYAEMKGHMEVAAAVLAAGGSPKIAGRKAGVSGRQVRKYMESAVFRERVQELQETLGNRIRGRVLKEVSRRTSPSMIRKMELLDLLRVGDRVGLGRGNASSISINTEIHQYESTFAQVVLSDAGEESEDFPTYEPTDLSVSGGNPPE